MADFVHHVLEDMVPELDDLERRGYFDKVEIKQIVQKRQDFEYNLRRRASIKLDFIRYIEYESSLEQLRQLRRKQRGITGTATLADHCIVRRIHFIYERMLRKFRGDLSLWSRWLRFCQQTRSNRQMSKVLTRALQLHPHCAALWTHAAAWEFEVNHNAVAARALMQRGLRMCKDAHALWHEYFRMELLYAARLDARRKVLLGMSSIEHTEKSTQQQQQPIEEDAAANAVLKGAVAKVVYINAVETVQDSAIQFRRGFLDVLEGIELPGKEELEAFILGDIEKNFQGSADALVVRVQHIMKKEKALLHVSGDDDNDVNEEHLQKIFVKALRVFDTHLKAKSKSSAELFSAAVGFIEEQVQEILEELQQSAEEQEGEEEEQEEDGNNNKKQGYPSITLFLIQKAIDYMTTAIERDQANNYILLTLPKVYLRLGEVEKAISVALDIQKQQGSGPHLDDTSISAILRQTLQMQSLADLDSIQNTMRAQFSSSNDILDLINTYTTTTVSKESLWLQGTRMAAVSSWPLQPFIDALIERQRVSATGPLTGAMGSVAACLYTAVYEKDGVHAARGMCDALLGLPLPGGEFIHAVLDVELTLYHAESESAMLDAKKKSHKKIIQNIFERGVAAYGAVDVDLWLRYARFDEGHGGGVYWRAVKALDDSDVFVAKMNLLAA